MIVLEPMDDAQISEFLERFTARRAERWVQRGIWTREAAPVMAREALAKYLPQGHQSPGQQFVRLVEASSKERVGDAWYSALEEGGKLQFWVAWIETYPAYRRRGYAREAIRALEKVAASLGADRIYLLVWLDNPAALTLYQGLGFEAVNMSMTKPLVPDPRPGDRPPVRGA